MYSLPDSIFGVLLQLVFHASSAVCLGIANAVLTPSLGLSSWRKFILQAWALVVWALTRVFLVFVLGLCLLAEAKARASTIIQLDLAALGSFAFVAMKTPVITKALQEAHSNYLRTQCSSRRVVALHRDLEIGQHVGWQAGLS